MRILASALLFLTAAGCAHAPAPAVESAPAATAQATPAAVQELPLLAPPVAPMPGTLDARRAQGLASKGKLPEALALFESVWSQGNRNPKVANAAAYAALQAGQPAQALTWLTRGAELGLPELRDVEALKKDEDLAPLRDDPGFTALLQRIPSMPDPFPGSNPELKQLFAEDQGDRMALGPKSTQDDFRRLVARDLARRERVKALIAAKALKTGADFIGAGFVFQHGNTLEDYALARQMGVEAAKVGHPDGLWLAAAAWDRWLMKAERPQRFGTQYRGTPGTPPGPMRLHTMDPSVTDAERARWGFLPLAEIPDTFQ